jgi:hypothetical protein
VRIYVFVKSILEENGKTIVEATNGGSNGPPYIRFELHQSMVPNCKIDKRYSVVIEEAE